MKSKSIFVNFYDIIYFMNREQRKRRQKIFTVLAETFMVFAVIAIVVVMTLVAMGYKFGKEGEIEQSGLMQLHTMPTGATVEIDGKVLFARSNLSESLSPGDHYIKITKDGYDSWEKTVTMEPGSLMRLYSPRLFLLERKPEKVIALGDLMFYSASENRNYLLYAKPDSTKWTLMNVKNDEVETTEVDVTKVFTFIKENKFTGKIEQIKWDSDEDKVLVKASFEGNTEWALIDLKDVTESVNVTKEFGMNFNRIELASGSAEQILTLENGNLRKIDIGNKSISRILVEKVAGFTNHGADIVYVTDKNDDGKRNIGIYKDGAKESVVVKVLDTDEKVLVGSSAYYDDEYLIYAVGDKIDIYSGEYPAYTSEMKKNNNNKVLLDSDDSTLKLVLEYNFGFVPDNLTVSRGGEYVLTKQGKNIVSIDLDTNKIVNYESKSDKVKWIDDSMLYDVLDNKVVVWDFDGANEREIVKDGVSDRAVMISGNNKYLYYVSSGNLIREVIR